MNIERGSLDDITRPASSDRPRTGSRPSSRVSLSSVTSTSRPPQRLTTPTLLELLPPEDISQQEHDLEVVEYQSSDSEDEGVQRKSRNITDSYKQLLYTNDFNIGDENAPPQSDSTRTKPTSEQSKEEDEDDRIQDPKLRAAIKKMKKLDKILAQKIKREKEVKRQRIRLQRQLQEELERAKPEGRDELKEVKENTLRFLALAPPPSHNEGVGLDDESPPVTPVFATQPHLDDMVNGNITDRSRTTNASEDTTTSAGGSQTSNASTNRGTETTKKSAGKSGRGSRKKPTSKTDSGLQNKDDFIQRNIQLASDAGSLIAMTDDEKKRLEDLLADVEMLKEDDDDNENADVNPFQLKVAPGFGFQPDQNDAKTLQDIDARLQTLLPKEDFESICSTPGRTESEYSEYKFSQHEYHGNMDLMLLGERALKETKEMRDQQSRLKEIEDELTNLQLKVESEMEFPHLSNVQLHELLEQCSRASSRATIETDAMANSPRSPAQNSVSSIYESPPKLADDVLRQLLEDARNELKIARCNSRLSTVREEDGSSMSRACTRSSSNNDFENVNERDMHVESVSELTIQELLHNPRATSRAASSGNQSPTPVSSENSPRSANVTDNGAFTESVGDSQGSTLWSSQSAMFTPRDKLPGLSGDADDWDVENVNDEDGDDDATPTPGEISYKAGSLLQGRKKDTDARQQNTMFGSGNGTAINESDSFTPTFGDDIASVDGENEESAIRTVAMFADMKGRPLSHLSVMDESDFVEDYVGSDSEIDDNFGQDDESYDGELRELHSPSVDSRASSQLSHPRTESDMSIRQLRISKSAFDSRPSSKAESNRTVTPITPDPLPKPPSKASNVKHSARSVKSIKKGLAMVSRSDPSATESRAASQTSTIRSDSQASTNTSVSSSDFEYEHDDEIRAHLILDEEQLAESRRLAQAQRRMAKSVNRSTTSPPHPPSKGHNTSKQKMRRKMPMISAPDVKESKTFSPPLL
ncbi:uncharacterized protein LOC100375256 [Saccoglossus kowalevskii]